MILKTTGTGYTIREVTAVELKSYLDQHFDSAFQNRLQASFNFLIDENSKSKISERQKGDQRFHLRLGVFLNDVIVGWHFGHALDAETYYMQNSAILEPHRGQGLYSELLKVIISKLAEEGFQVITSNHHGNNAAVLIPKLKQGFIITGTHFHERFKFLIELKYFVNEDRRKAFCQNLGLDL
jgi:L-amino acid N-acyltransferase YncA